MTVLRRFGTAAATLALALGAACHRDVTEPEPDYGPDAETRAASEAFYHVADSLYQAGAGLAVVNAYSGMGRYVTAVGRASPVTISIDGVAEEYLAVVQELGLESISCPSGTTCLSLPRVRGFVAWRRGDPRRVVQLSMPFTDDPTVGAGPGFAAFTAAITYFDGAGGYYVGSSMTSPIGLASASTEPCVKAPPPNPLANRLNTSVIDPYWTRCTKAEFTVALPAATVQPPAGVGLPGNKGSGSHTVAIASSLVHGGIILLPRWACSQCAVAGYPDFTLPPLDARPRTYMTSTLNATGSDVVTLTFTVKNSGTTPETLGFGSGQRYDFVIVNPTTSAILWRWSADKVFTTALGSLTLAPGEQVVYTEQWTATTKTQLLALATLTSGSHYTYSGRYFGGP